MEFKIEKYAMLQMKNGKQQMAGEKNCHIKKN